MKNIIGIHKIVISVTLLFMMTIQLNAQFVLSAEIRPRSEYRDGFKTPKGSDDEAAFFTEQRSRINFDFTDTTYVFKLSLQDIRIWGENDQNFKEDDGNTFLNEAWVKYNASSKFGIKVGRQEIAYGNQHYFGVAAWGQQGRRHDAVLLMYNNKEANFKFDFGLAFNSDDDIPEPQNIQSVNASFYNRNNYKNMQYLWMNKKFSGLNVSFLASNFGFQYDLENVSYKQTLGFIGNTTGDNLKFGWDFYYQMGKIATNNLSAYLADIYVTYKTDATPITLGAVFVSGKDNNDTSSDVKHFRTDFGSNHRHYGHMDYFFVGPLNEDVGVTDIYLKTKFKIKDNSSLMVHAHHFLSGSNQFDDTNTQYSKSLGTEFDFNYNICIKESMSFTVGYSFMLATDAMKGIRNRDATFNSWGWMMLAVTPELLRSH